MCHDFPGNLSILDLTLRQNIYLAGSIPQLGAWAPESAVSKSPYFYEMTYIGVPLDLVIRRYLPSVESDGGHPRKYDIPVQIHQEGDRR